jgi:hypothetical protein
MPFDGLIDPLNLLLAGGGFAPRINLSVRVMIGTQPLRMYEIMYGNPAP